MMVNSRTHRFIDCDNFPQGSSEKVKEKMTTSDLHLVDCDVCKRRILERLMGLNWHWLFNAEVAGLEISAAEVEEKR